MSVLNLTPNKDLQSGSTQHISAYGSFPVGNDICIIRVADHNTFLYNWIDKNQHIDLTTSANYAITFVDEVPFHNNPNKDNIVNASNPPDVILRQYVYNVTALTDAEVTLVMDECIRLSQTGVFTDPLEEDDEKHAVIYRHRTNQPTEDMTNKTRKAHRKKKAVQNKKTISKTNNQPATDNNKTDKNESKNMSKKNTIRLTESDLKRVISESVKKVLNEGFYPDEIYGAGASWDGFADEEPPMVPIRFGEQNRPKFKKMTDEAYHLLQELRYNVATKEQNDEIVQAMKLVRHACMGR